MKGRVILIDMPKDRAGQAALLVDGRLEDLVIDPLKTDTTPTVGAIYLTRIDRLIPKTKSAFVKLTPEHSGFLRDAKSLKESTVVLVQATSYPEPGKATPVSDRVLLKGQVCILTPGAPGINISRSIKNAEERGRLTAIAEAAMAGQSDVLGSGEFGLIIRTGAAGASEDWITMDITLVAYNWREVARRRDRATAPTCVGGWVPHVIACTEWAIPMPDKFAYRNSADIDDFLFDAGSILSDRRLEDRIEPFDGPDLFDHYGVWDEIERLKSPRVDLPSGAWMAVEATRAMVTVDVNTAGEFSGGAPLTANLEAAKELPRQLRLRGLGGQIIIDFAPLKKTDRKRVEEALKAAFRKDSIETTLAGWTPLGNFELQRKRARRPLSELLP